jgi:AcrR family transcriptional regulator
MADDLPYRDRLRARMLDIAERILAGEGLSALQARRVTQEAECSIGTLYNIFDGLDGLIVAANERTLEALGGALGAALGAAQAKPMRDRLEALALSYSRFAIDNELRWKAMFEHKLPVGTLAPESFRAKREQLFGVVESILAEAIPDTERRRVGARALFSAVHGIVTLALDRTIHDLSPAEVEGQARFIVETVAKGLTAERI